MLLYTTSVFIIKNIFSIYSYQDDIIFCTIKIDTILFDGSFMLARLDGMFWLLTNPVLPPQPEQLIANISISEGICSKWTRYGLLASDFKKDRASRTCSKDGPFLWLPTTHPSQHFVEESPSPFFVVVRRLSE